MSRMSNQDLALTYATAALNIYRSMSQGEPDCQPLLNQVKKAEENLEDLRTHPIKPGL